METELVRVNGEIYRVPKGTSLEQLEEYFSSNPPAPAPSPPQEQAQAGGKIDPSLLKHDKDWLRASKTVFEATNGKAWTGNDEDLAEYGLDQMGWFNYNLPVMAVDAGRLSVSSPEHKQAFLHLMDTYDRLEISWGGFGRFIKGVAADPTTYVGLATFGVGVAGSTATKLASKEAVKSALRTGLVTGIEGAVLNTTQGAIRQSVEVDAGRRERISGTELLGDAAIGFGAGAVLGGAVDAAATALRKAPAKLTSDLPQPGKAADAPAAPKAVEPGPAPASVAPEKGQLELFDLPPASKPAFQSTGAADDIIRQVENIAPDTGGRVLIRQKDALRQVVSSMSDQLTTKSPSDIPQVVEELRRWGTQVEQDQLVKAVIREATDSLDKQGLDLTQKLRNGEFKDADELEAIKDEITRLDALRGSIKAADTDLSSADGLNLGSRAGQNLFNTNENRGLTPEELFVKEKGKPWDQASPDQKLEYQLKYYDRYDEYLTGVRRTAEIQKMEQAVQEAFDSGNISEAIRLSNVKHELEDLNVRVAMANDGLVDRIYAMSNSAVQKLNEYIISTVFSPSTLIINFIPSVVKTLYRPTLDAIARGGDAIAWKAAVANYSAMLNTSGAAAKAATLAFKYERSLLTDEGMRLLENGTQISGLKGRVVRFFPRVLAATDEFFARVNYQGFIAGNATADAMEAGIANGLKGKKLERFVQREVQNALKGAFESKIDANYVIPSLRKRGESLGYKGEALDLWIKAELDKNPDLFRRATNESGRNFTDDLLFKRPFSGDNGPSRFAKTYEETVNRHPMLRLAGQLFFRTPVRVFEEGIRLTAGLNLIAPRFLADLRGQNGVHRQVRAQGEALLSYAIAGWVMTKYAQGQITGGGPSNYRERRLRENAKDWEPYTLRFDNSSTFSFRNLDPFATPLKIIVNGLDRLNEVEYRKAQGELIDKDFKEVLGWVGGATGAIAQAFSDASLFTGADQVFQFAKAMADPDDRENALQRWFGQKTQLLIPNVVQKVQLQDAPFLNDPYSVEQFLRARINPGDPLVPKQYDAMGFHRKMGNPLASLTGINITTKEQREATLPEKAREVAGELEKIGIATGKHFTAPFKHPDMPGVDLRSTKTADESESLYDRWQRIYNNSGVVDALYTALVENKGSGSYGTKSNDGTKAKLAEKIISTFRNASFAQLKSEEDKAMTAFIKKFHDRSDALQGNRDVPSLPFR